MMKKLKLLTVLLSTLIICLVVVVVDETISRYIKQERDEIYATYTSLYFESDLKNGTVVLENNEAYLSFKLKNYIGEDITKRDITYEIKSPNYVTKQGDEIVVDQFGNMTVNSNEYTGEQYVKDVWGAPQLVGNDSHKYDVDIIDNDGVKVSDTLYKFPYQTSTEGQASSHTITVKIQRIASSTFTKDEDISVVVQLNEPYHEVLIINVKIMNHLISYSHTTSKVFETTFDAIKLQTVNVFSHVYDEAKKYYVDRIRTVEESGKKYAYVYTANPFIIEFDFKGLYLERLNLQDLHINLKNLNTSGNYDHITESYLKELINDPNGGKYVGYAPQASDFSIEFLKVSNDYAINVMIYIYLEKYEVDASGNITNLVEAKYYPYTSVYGGYSEFDDGNLSSIIIGN